MIEALICPECGGKVEPLPAGSEYAKCAYCLTSFKVDGVVPKFAYEPIASMPEAGPNPTRNAGTFFIIAIVIAVVLFSVFKFMSVQNSTRQTVDAAQSAANDAKETANIIRKAAEEMANKAIKQATNIPTPTPLPPARNTKN
jgi:hypothetical protein